MPTFDSPELLKAISDVAKADYSAAVETLRRIADEGNPKAQCNLANLYHFGWGVSIDAAKAIELYSGVAEKKIQDESLSGIAYQNLATIYTTGLPGIEPNPQKAAEYFALAKELGVNA